MRLIDADALIEQKFKNPISYNAFVSLVKRQPTVDSYKHGHWVARPIDDEEAYKCSECGDIEYYTCNYCPCCGAKMDEVEE